MNNEEVSKEIEEFLKYNAPEINALKQLNPELATAFNNVIVEIDKQYGKNSIGSEINNLLTKTPAQIINYSRFLAGDYLSDVNEIKTPFIIYKNNEFSDEMTLGKGSFDEFDDVLIVKDIYEINGLQYYATTYSSNIDYYNDLLMVNDGDYEIFLFEISKLDEFYNNYYEKNVRSIFKIGEFLIGQKVSQSTYDSFDKINNNDFKIKKYWLEKNKLGMLFPSSAISPIEIQPSTILKDYVYFFVKDIIKHIDGMYYILQGFYFGHLKSMAFKVEDFDFSFGNFFRSIKNNSIMQVTDIKTMDTVGYIWYKNMKIEYLDYGNYEVYYKSSVLSGDLTNETTYPSDGIPIENFYDYVLGNDAISQGRKLLSNKKSREIIDEFETNVPPSKIVIGSGSQMSSNNFSSIERPTYMNNAVKNKDNAKSGQPTSKATAFNVTEIVMGTDGFLYDVAMKNGKKVWSKGENIFDTLPIDVFEGNTPSPTYIFKLSVLKQYEKSLNEYLSYFDPSDADYMELKQNIDTIQKNVMYNPNVDIYS